MYYAIEIDFFLFQDLSGIFVNVLDVIYHLYL
jgi:hypothetical protein